LADCATPIKEAAQRQAMSVKAFFIQFKMVCPKLVIYILYFDRT
jgi:hypothetical protein